MEVSTQFGTQNINPDTVITFPEGMAGFEDLTRFKLFHEADKPSVFWLQSIDDPSLQFSVTDPETFNVDYQITLSDNDLALLDVQGEDQIHVLVTVARDENADNQLHANFMGPILINSRSRTGMQKTLNQIESRVIISAN